VTGVVALLLAVDPRLPTAAVYRLLRDSSAPVTTAAGIANVVNACAALVALGSHGDCRHAAASVRVVDAGQAARPPR
jgi:hypothetical protein